MRLPAWVAAVAVAAALVGLAGAASGSTARSVVDVFESPDGHAICALWKKPAIAACYDPHLRRSNGTYLTFYTQQGRLPWFAWGKLQLNNQFPDKTMKPGWEYFVRIWRVNHWMTLVQCKLAHEKYIRPLVVDCWNADGRGFIFGNGVHYRYGI